MEMELKNLDNHIIVCGLSVLGEAVCCALEEEKKMFVAVDQESELVEKARARGWCAVLGNVTESDVWRAVFLSRAHSVISTLVDESANVYVILRVREQHPDCFIISCGATRASEGRLKRVGANRVVSPFIMGGAQMANTALRPAAIQFFDMAFKRDNVELEMDELTVPEDSSILGNPLQELYDLSELDDVIIVGYISEGQDIRFNPKGDTVFRAGDMLICLGHVDDLAQLKNALTQ